MAPRRGRRPAASPAHPFLTGNAGGFLGSMLFSSMGGMGHAMGGILTFLIIGLLIFSRSGSSWGGASRPPATGGMPCAIGPGLQQHRRGPGSAYRRRRRDADLTAFQGLHAGIQEAWSRGDLGRMRQLMTPEMLAISQRNCPRNAAGLAEPRLQRQPAQGRRSARPGKRRLQYATAYMRWTANDVDVRIAGHPTMPIYIVSGNPRVPAERRNSLDFRFGARRQVAALRWFSRLRQCAAHPRCS